MKYTIRFEDYVNEGVGEYSVETVKVFNSLGELACFIKKYSLGKQNRIIEIIEGETAEIGIILSQASELLGENL